jgi:RNA polymerase-binding transcription factor DksA/ribosome-associated translation inhibitor RaiA
MPDGVLQWYDDRRGEGRVVRGGREYPVRAADMEPRARVPGARLHFDVRRHEGVAIAVDVRLREGTRVSRRQRRPRGGPSPVLPVVEVVARDPRADAAREYAERKLRAVVEAIGAPMLFARVKLSVAPDPAVARPARAEAALDVNGELVRAQVAAHSLHEAVDLLEARLRGRVAHAAERVRTLRLRPAETTGGEWHHGQAPTDRPAWYDRPPEERKVVRRKTFALDDLTVDEAAFDMELLDHDFYLFIELATGVDAVMHHRPDGRLGLRRLHPVDLPAAAAAVEVVLEAEGAPSLGWDEAVEWLDVAGEPFVFFRNQESGRGNVVYRRYDGHYGLITPADEPAAPAEPSTARRRLRDELSRLEAVRTVLIGEGLAEESEAASVAETSTIDQHQADLGTETFEREQDMSLLQDVELEIGEVGRAFVRIDRDTYGRCEACGVQIPDERLVAMPAARFCLEHQAAAEIITGLGAV